MQKKVRFELEGKIYEVGVERTGDRLTLSHEGERYVVSLLPEQKEIKSSPTSAVSQSGAAASPQQAPLQAPLSMVAAAPVAAPSEQIDYSGTLCAPMTGVIKEIRVAPGRSVEEGQVILIMEAMKMDIDVPAPIAGTVAEVLVKPGDTVNAKQELVVIH
jgi:glutaconyl-CoA decarboxylase